MVLMRRPYVTMSQQHAMSWILNIASAGAEVTHG